MTRYFYSYTDRAHLRKILSQGMYAGSQSYTDMAFFDPYTAGQMLGVRELHINCVLQFEDDGLFRSRGIVSNAGRFPGGGSEFSHPGRPRPVAVRSIRSHWWRMLK